MSPTCIQNISGFSRVTYSMPPFFTSARKPATFHDEIFMLNDLPSDMSKFDSEKSVVKLLVNAFLVAGVLALFFTGGTAASSVVASAVGALRFFAGFFAATVIEQNWVKRFVSNGQVLF